MRKENSGESLSAGAYRIEPGSFSDGVILNPGDSAIRVQRDHERAGFREPASRTGRIYSSAFPHCRADSRLALR